MILPDQADHGDCQPTVMRFVPEIANSKLAYIMHKPMFRGIKAVEMTSDASPGVNKAAATNSRVDFTRFFATKPSAAEAASTVSEALAAKLADIMALSRDELDITAPIRSFGVDSLVAVEIRNWLSKEVRADVAIFDILEGSSTAALGAAAVGKSSYFA